MAFPKVFDEINERLAHIEDMLTEMATGAKAPQKPWPDYDKMNVAQILRRVDKLTDEERAQVLAYEQRHKKRQGVIEKIGWNS